MNFELNAEQQAIMHAVERLLAQHAGPARAIELNRAGQYDTALHSRLADAGFHTIASDLADGSRPSALEAALVVEAIARAGGVVACAAQLLVAPFISDQPIAGPIALCTQEDLAQALPVRFGAHAANLLVLQESAVSIIPVAAGELAPVRSSFGYPMGRLAHTGRWPALRAAGTTLDADAAHTLRRWWRLALAVEAVGTMEAALAHTVEYLKQRRQFGRAIASFQAIQHRLSLCAIQVEASRWLAREAAFQGAPEEAAAVAAAFALDAADLVFTETHQMSGAIGFTREFNLHVWSMRLLALRQELEGVTGARRAVVAARWGVRA